MYGSNGLVPKSLKYMGEEDRMVEHMKNGKKNGGWMMPKEISKRQINTYFPNESITIAPNHVNEWEGQGKMR